MTKKIAVLINPTSGKGRGGREAIDLALQLRSHGIDSNFLVGTGNAPIPSCPSWAKGAAAPWGTWTFVTKSWAAEDCDITLQVL